MSEFEGKIEDADKSPKEMRPNKDGSISWKYGIKVGGVWHSIFGSKAEVIHIKTEVDAGGNYAKGTYKLSKDGKYRNIEEVVISRIMKNPEETTDPAKGLAGGVHQGLGKPREDPVKEERIGVEEVDALVDRHYIDMALRALSITNQVEAKKPAPWKSEDQRFAFLLAVFDKLAGPEIYIRAEVEKFLMTKRVK